MDKTLQDFMGNSAFHDLTKAFEPLGNMVPVMPEFDRPLLSVPDSIANPAKWTYTRLGEYIKKFEENLNSEQEIGARLVSFGQAVVFHIDDVGYYGPDIITFHGVNDNGETVQLIQNVNQLSVLLVAMKKRHEKPNRIGYIWGTEDNSPS